MITVRNKVIDYMIHLETKRLIVMPGIEKPA
jgi:hypothetical protein